MNIWTSVKSLTDAGLVVTVASVLAFAPAVVGEPPAPTVHPTTTAPAVDLAAAISPQDIQDVIDALQGAASTVVSGAAKLAMLPATNLADGVLAVQTASFEFFTALISETDNPQLKSLLTGLRGVQAANLAYLVTAADDLEGTSQFWIDDMASLIQDTLDQAIAATVTALAGVINNPLALSSYTSLLGAAITTAFDGAGNLVWLVNDALQLPMEIADSGFSDLARAATYSVANWSDFVGATLIGLADQTGVSFIAGLAKALAAVTTTPISIVAEGLGDIAYWTPVFTTVIGPEQIVYATANLVAPVFYGLASLGQAVTTIGKAPTNPVSYITSLQGFVTAGFNVGSEAIWSVNQVAQIGPQVFNSLLNPTAIALDAFTEAVANVASGLLAAGGAPQNAVDAPIAFAANASNAIWNATGAVLNTSAAVADWMQTTANQAMAANNAVGERINDWLGGLAGSPPAGSVVAAKAPELTQLVKRQTAVPAAKAKSGLGSHKPSVGSSKTVSKGSDKKPGGKAGSARGHRAAR
ncbi:hypothetical protein [Mycobacterium sp. shizuoka-1]|uniref:hypothetical protein n=1 Tax=Mycobacterium sp. shizuoka-1 TaxID=2039281 RepID=UPI000C066C84|nr:hypothetical protein [Mycobacterium sp. shizuoka-1]GAY15932.1 hypothetical protein MSZK_26580 [Mycobacterium sp. shizuoka-1]